MNEALDTESGVDRRKLWTREEAARVAELFPGQRYELTEGELINKTGQKPPHAYVLMVLTRLLVEAFPVFSRPSACRKTSTVPS